MLDKEKKQKRPLKGRVFQCTGFPNCNKLFTRLEHLARHRRKHTGERPFTCPHCSKNFSRLDNLRQHKQTVHAYENFVKKTRDDQQQQLQQTLQDQQQDAGPHQPQGLLGLLTILLQLALELAAHLPFQPHPHHPHQHHHQHHHHHPHHLHLPAGPQGLTPPAPLGAHTNDSLPGTPSGVPGSAPHPASRTIMLPPNSGSHTHGKPPPLLYFTSPGYALHSVHMSNSLSGTSSVSGMSSIVGSPSLSGQAYRLPPLELRDAQSLRNPPKFNSKNRPRPLALVHSCVDDNVIANRSQAALNIDPPLKTAPIYSQLYFKEKAAFPLAAAPTFRYSAGFSMVLPLSPLFHQLFNQVALASMVLGMKIRSAPTFSRMPLASRTSLASSTSTLPSLNSSKSVLKEEAEETELKKEVGESALLAENVLLGSTDTAPAKSGWLNGVLNNNSISATDVKRANISNLVCADDQEKPVDVDVTLTVPT